MSFDGDKTSPLVRERKFVSDRVTADAVVSVLRAYCVPDVQFPAGELESIYFDSPTLSSYWEKANGDALKRKVRIRWYRTGADANAPAPAFLEIKDRIGAARDKARFKFHATPRDLETRPLDDPWFAALLSEQAESASFAIPQSFVPTVAIRYRRHRLVCPATLSRVSVDYAIVCSRANRSLFGTASQPFPLRTHLTICEAKSGTTHSWPFCDALMRLGLRAESFSKYGFFVEKLLNGGFP